MISNEDRRTLSHLSIAMGGFNNGVFESFNDNMQDSNIASLAAHYVKWGHKHVRHKILCLFTVTRQTYHFLLLP